MSELRKPEEILQAEDNVGDDSSLFLRPLRLLFERGTPLGEMAILAFQRPQGTWPFGIITRTKNNRIVFWPVLPKKATLTDASGKLSSIDHITLELASERIHVTALPSPGRKSHNSASDIGAAQAWRLQDCPRTGLALFFVMLLKMSVLKDQENLVQRSVLMPDTDADRRKRAFVNYTSQLRMIDIGLPPTTHNSDFVFCSVYLDREPTRAPAFASEDFPAAMVSSEIEGCPDGSAITIQPTFFDLNMATRLVVAVCCPQGIAKQAVAIGLPRKKGNSDP